MIKLRATPDMDTKDCEAHNTVVGALVEALQRILEIGDPHACAVAQDALDKLAMGQT